MKLENQELNMILKHLHEQRGFDFSGYRIPMLKRRIQKRLFNTKVESLSSYFEYIEKEPSELDNIIDALTINVSHFFRNTLPFELIRKTVLPEIILAKSKGNKESLRIWSTACSYGEEAYTMAIIINEILEKENVVLNSNIIATDIDKKAIEGATKGVYHSESVKNIKYGLLEKYFTYQEGQFIMDRKIREKVQFSFYDLLDQKRLVPPESIFGGFDIVLCRNVLIYFNMEYQDIIFKKLYSSLNTGGYLILGEAEMPTDKFKNKFKRVNKLCKIYKKIG